MDWLSKMNGAVSYIEDNLTNEIDYAEVARRACCSVHHFQRLFSFIADVPLSEYVRRRRLTLAAFELQTTDAKVLDLSLKYGYESPEAFTRAFQNLHGVTPTAARRTGVQVKAYPRMTFSIQIKGDVAMQYRIEQAEAFTVVGVKERVNMKEAFHVIPGLWDKAKNEGLLDRLIHMPWANTPNLPRGILGVCANGDFGNREEFDYYLGAAAELETPEDMVTLHVPASTWAVFEVTPDVDVQGIWKRLYTEWVPTSGYNLANVPGIECYCPPGHNPSAEVWIAVEKI